MLTHDPAINWTPPHATIAAPATAPASAPSSPGRRVTRARLGLVAGAVAAATAGSVAAVIVTETPQSSLRALPANSVGVIDADGSLHDAVSIGQNPSSVAYGAGSLWATSTTDGTVSRIDPHTRVVIQTIRVGDQPVAVAARGMTCGSLTSARAA